MYTVVGATTSRTGGDNIPRTTIPTESTTYLDLEGVTDGGGMEEEVFSIP
jgi:hypothetical protein